jgi:predicted SnoaL-like aldol condensation-catalyzing enzyme
MARRTQYRKDLTMIKQGLLTSALVAAIALSACSSSSSDATSSDAGATALEVNKMMVTNFYNQLFNESNYSVIDTNLDPSYVQHNPTVADGQEALKQFVMMLRVRFPDNHNTIARVTGQGDLVVIHHHAVSVPGTAGTAIIDLFRVGNGKIVEHWDALQPVPATTASGNDMFATLSKSGDTSTASSQSVVVSYFTAVTDKHDLTAVDRLVAPDLFQHDPSLANGSAALKSGLAASFQANPQLTFSSLKVIAEADLVTLRYHRQNSPEDLGQAVTDIYRVGQGKIVEHWSVVQDVPAMAANNNTMF